MIGTDKTPTLLGEALRSEIKALMREVLQEVQASNGKPGGLLTSEDLAERLKVPLSWVYEQSRQGMVQIMDVFFFESLSDQLLETDLGPLWLIS